MTATAPNRGRRFVLPEAARAAPIRAVFDPDPAATVNPDRCRPHLRARQTLRPARSFNATEKLQTRELRMDIRATFLNPERLYLCNNGLRPFERVGRFERA
jgi:hypothetical protein